MSGRRGDEWLDAEIEELRSMAEKNASAVRIAARLKRTVSSIQRRAYAQGIKIRTLRETRSLTKFDGARVFRQSLNLDNWE